MKLQELPPSTKFTQDNKLYKRLRMTSSMAIMIESHFSENMIPVLNELDEVNFMVPYAEVSSVPDEEEANYSLTVAINGIEEIFTGETSRCCLQKLKAAITQLATNGDLIEAELEKDYKETRTLKPVVNEVDNSPTGEWIVDINENGCGEERDFPNQTQAIIFFMRCAEENGEHWG